MNTAACFRQPVSIGCPREIRAGGRCFFRILSHASLGVLLLAGCQRSVHWDFGRFEDVQPRAAQQSKLTFVYFKAWWSVECTRFEEEVLLDPAVLSELDRMVCVPLNYNWDEGLAARWGLADPPAFAIVSPPGEVVARGSGKLTREDVMAAVREARAHVAGLPGASSRPVVP